jgi:hypothetical protein
MPPDATDDAWDTPGMEEIGKAIENSKLLAESGAETPPTPEPPPMPPAPGPTDEAPAPEPEPVPEGEAGPKKITIKGKEYTEDELDERLGKGTMLHADYTKKTMDLAEQRRAWERERQEQQALIERARQATGSERTGLPEADEIEEMLNDPEVPESVSKALRAVREENRALQYRIDQEKDESAKRDFVADRMGLFDTELDALCKKHKVTDPFEREHIEAVILKANPNIEDRNDFRESINNLFETEYTRLAKRDERIRLKGLKDVAALPTAPSVKGGGTVPRTPEPKTAPTFDDGNAEAEMTERFRRAGIIK